MKLAVIGLGKIGSALIQGILDVQVYQAKNIIACDININYEGINENYYGIKTTANNSLGAREADVILLAVKPQVINKVLREIKNEVQEKLVVTIAAGISNSHLSEILPASTRTIRVMPNTPVLVREGMSVIAPGSLATEDDIKIVSDLFSGVGKVMEIEEELMDAVTGLSGSGPAYIYLIIEALADGGVLTGLSREDSIRLVAQTVLGSARMVLETGKHTGELRDMVTSPGGTSIRGIEVLESHGVRGKLIDAVKEAAERSREMNNM